MPLLSAYLLVTHGSRDPRPQTAVEQLAQLLCQKLRGEMLTKTQELTNTEILTNSSVNVVTVREPLVGTACLELAPLPLHEQIQQFGKYASSAGFKHIQILPLFLLPGVHVMEDIPAEVTKARENFGSDLTMEVRPYLGFHSQISQVLTSNLHGFNADEWILLSHGSRRQGANYPVEALANKIGALVAYWSVPPSWESQAKSLLIKGKKRIGILPYFLFTGGITDAIAQSVKQIKQEYPAGKFHLAKPLGATSELAELIWDLTSK
ncbi:sirohydrochlorin chelatase [Aerosakkonemataceae cyanobacterium BLCC-F50]|uniref:Sirohydrochlorin chelatase n=1 Tax=Floridaenema flaviceps BLCC-F50 TaxID=3153642 RepID=A0ABV4XNJ1_9CYAN